MEERWNLTNLTNLDRLWEGNSAFKGAVLSDSPAGLSLRDRDRYLWGISLGRLYTVEIFLLNGPITEKFAKKNPVVSRTIQLRGDQTLEDLHQAIFDAYGRWEEHMYEFQFGKEPMDPEARRYVLPNALEIQKDQPNPPIGRVDQTTLDSLGLKVGDRFGYWFDFGDDWWHQINVEAVEDRVPRGKLPKVTKKVGKSPPQYADEDE